MQPDGQPGGISDSVVSGDVHHHHYQQTPSQSDGTPPTYVPPQQLLIGHPQAAQPTVGLGMPVMPIPSTSAATALILSILSLFCGGICLAIPGLIIANQALAITDQIPGHPDAGNAKAAKIISWIVIGLTGLAILLWVVMGIVLVSTDGDF
jgi:hypothetical protein